MDFSAGKALAIGLAFAHFYFKQTLRIAIHIKGWIKTDWYANGKKNKQKREEANIGVAVSTAADNAFSVIFHAGKINAATKYAKRMRRRRYTTFAR